MTEHRPTAGELFEHRDDPDEWSDESEEIEVRPRGSEVVSFRLPAEDMDALEIAAREAGETLSEFIRNALSVRMHGDARPPATVDVQTGRASLVLSVVNSLRSSRADAENSVSRRIPDFPPTGVNTTN